MKKQFILYSFVCTVMLFGQNTQFEITDEGLTKYIVTEIPGVAKEVAYKKTLDWINKVFNTPNKVIKGNIENEYVRIEGITENAVRYPIIGGTIFRPIKFEIEVSFKNDKYKFEVKSLKEKNLEYPSVSIVPFKETDFSKTSNLKGYNPVRKSNGEFRNWYKYAYDIPIYFNSLNISLKEYITEKNKNDDW